MIGNIDSPEDFLATGLCIRGGISPIGQDSRSFLTGHHLGFLLGFIVAYGKFVGQHEGVSIGANAAYQEAIAHVRAEDSK
jgi:hypothetical protein